jgi:hypothetical protein
LDQPPALTERIELVIQVTSGHGQARAATRMCHLVCHFQVNDSGHRLATFSLSPALSIVRPAAVLRVTAHSELRARPTHTKRPGPGGRGPFQRSRPGAACFRGGRAAVGQQVLVTRRRLEAACRSLVRLLAL